MSKAKDKDELDAGEVSDAATNGEASAARRKRGRDQTEEVQKVRRQRVYAGPCQAVPAHTNTRVYKTDGRTRYCVCDECGHGWKKTGPKAGEEEEEE